MKDRDRSALLGELYPDGGGPPVEQVLAAVRRDRGARARQRYAAAALILGASAVLATFWKAPLEVALSTQTAEAKAALTEPATPAPSAIAQGPAVEAPDAMERISDDELLAAVGGPAAIVTLPDGRQTVLYFVPVAQR